MHIWGKWVVGTEPLDKSWKGKVIGFGGQTEFKSSLAICRGGDLTSLYLTLLICAMVVAASNCKGFGGPISKGLCTMLALYGEVARQYGALCLLPL